LDFDEAPRVAGLILAGGEGKRWGGPKAWARLPDGRTFLEACFRILDEAGARPIVSTLPPGTDDPGIEGLSAIVLPAPGLDMFASINAGLDRALEFPEWTKITLLPVDHPLITPDAVATLVRTTAPAAIPSYRGKHGHRCHLQLQHARRSERGAQNCKFGIMNSKF
jgi:molybdopterin-guanine dinucleotide biosynthesis protein A